MSATATLTVGGVRAAVQELRDSSLEDLRRLLAEYSLANQAGEATDVDALARKVETTTRMVTVARLLRAGAKWGAITIIAALISSVVDHAVNYLMGWTPPSITVVRQMSPAQVDELSQQIVQRLEQMHRELEHH